MNTYTEKITYVIVDTHVYELSLLALRHSQNNFPLNNILIYSDDPSKWGEFSKKVIKIPKISSMNEYTKTLFIESSAHLETDFALIIQWDGFVLNSDRFSNIFLEYDYIGATWNWFDHFRVGNGGFSLRSKKLMSASAEMYKFVDGDEPEDLFICRKMRIQLESQYEINFAPETIANHFSREYVAVGYPTFGFHGVHLLPYIYQNNIDLLIEKIPINSSIKYKSQITNALANLAPEKIPNFLRKFEEVS